MRGGSRQKGEGKGREEGEGAEVGVFKEKEGGNRRGTRRT